MTDHEVVSDREVGIVLGGSIALGVLLPPARAPAFVLRVDCFRNFLWQCKDHELERYLSSNIWPSDHGLIKHILSLRRLWCWLFALFLSLCCFLLTSRAQAQLLVSVIIQQLLSSGDIERNPGPNRDDKPTPRELQCMSYYSKDGTFRLMDRVKPRVIELAIALNFPRHVIHELEIRQKPVYYLLGGWLDGENLEYDSRPLTWGTLITALYEAGLQQEAKILEENFLIEPPVAKRKVNSNEEQLRNMEVSKMMNELWKCKTTQKEISQNFLLLCFMMMAAFVCVLAVLVYIAVSIPSCDPTPRTC